MKEGFPNDNQILELFCNGSESALEEVSKKYGAAMLRLAKSILSDEQDAEECVNDAYLSAWQAVPAAKPSNLKAYLLQSVRNAALERLRSSRAKKRGGGVAVSSFEELEECIPDSRREEPGDNEKLRLQLESFLAGLSAEKRAIFLGRFWFSYSVTEIAWKTGKSEKYISNQLYNLKRKLRKHLDRKEG